MPCQTAFCSVPLDFSAEKISNAKAYLRIGTFPIDKGGEVVVHDEIAVPPTKRHRFQKPDSVIAHLIVGYQHGPCARPSIVGIPRFDIQIPPFSGIRLF